MNKTAIKNFAIWARNKLIADISYRAGLMGITADGIQNALPQSTGTTEFYDIGTSEPYAIAGDAVKQRRHLVELIRAKERETNYRTAYKYVLEEVAYTWFNRLIAVRFMEVNDYLPSHIRVLSSDSGKMEPDLVTTPFDAELSFTREEEQLVYQMKQENKIDELFRILFIKQCNALNEMLPALFEKTSDYTELLLNLSIIDQDGVVYHLVHDILEEDFDVERGGQVEIIGWMYQYYNTEPKNEAFAKTGKISKEEVPAVTQLFTPDWIVRYMVENSVGRLWIEHLKALDETVDESALAANFGWKYYLPEAKQEPETEIELKKLRKERAALTPEQITIIDPCMGSGHILVYAFDVLIQIYENAGYGQRDAAKSILENNLFGLDIDDRAYQMAFFAVMMKAREYNRRILNGDNTCKAYSIQESNGITDAALGDMGASLSEEERKIALKAIKSLIAEFKDAKEYGSILNIEKRDWELLRRFAVPNIQFGQLTLDMNGVETAAQRLQEIIDVAQVMANAFSVTCTNPPYMNTTSASDKLAEFVKKLYPNSKTDMFSVFIERNKKFTLKNGFVSMITQQAWMFLGGFESLRQSLLNDETIVNMAHLGARAFDEIAGEVVQTVAFVTANYHISNYIGTYSRLIDEPSERAKENAFLQKEKMYFLSAEAYEKLPGQQIGYWAPLKLLTCFKGKKLSEIASVKVGLQTGDNDKFVRVWFEVDKNRINFSASSCNDALKSGDKWFPYNKGGSYQKWYGNNDYIVNWEDDGFAIKHNFDKKGKLRSRPQNTDYYFKQSISWSKISMTGLAFRFKPQGAVFDVAGTSVFADNTLLFYIMGLCNSVVAKEITNIISPTLNYEVGHISSIPIIIDNERKQLVEMLVKENIALVKSSWDTQEISWDFSGMQRNAEMSVESHYQNSLQLAEQRKAKVKENEERLNECFIDIYGLNGIYSKIVDESLISINIPEKSAFVKAILSYAVGCMFGRYSLDVDGLAFAGGDWNATKYTSFLPDTDNVIPITDEEYLEDDIVSRLCTWLKVAYGEATLEDNLDFIANGIGSKGGSSREIIRNYFLNDFFKDHSQTYSVTGSGKRPIYWLFDSGKQNGFKALIYLHRYSADTIGNLRIDYLHRMQRVYESESGRMQDMIDHSTSAREVALATKRREKLQKQLKECREYDEKLAHLALSRIELDLDDGVKKNYRKIQTANDGKFYEVLADSKNIMAKE